MDKPKKEVFYAVAKGRNIGIFTTWNECKEAVSRFPFAKYQKFTKIEDAIAFMAENREPTQPYTPITIPERTEPVHVQLDIPPDYYVYTDGACTNNGKQNAKAGIGIFFGENDPRNVSKRVIGKQTNNVAELTAVLSVYPIIVDDVLSGKIIMIVTDSEYAIKCITSYGKKCAKDGWLNIDIPNQTLVRDVYETYMGIPNIRFMHINSHTGNKDIHSIGNEHADRLANESLID